MCSLYPEVKTLDEKLFNQWACTKKALASPAPRRLLPYNKRATFVTARFIFCSVFSSLLLSVLQAASTANCALHLGSHVESPRCGIKARVNMSHPLEPPSPPTHHLPTTYPHATRRIFIIDCRRSTANWKALMRATGQINVFIFFKYPVNSMTLSFSLPKECFDSFSLSLAMQSTAESC